MMSPSFPLLSSSLRERHLAVFFLGVAASLLFPEPGWGALGLLLVPLAMRHRRWVLAAFFTGLAGGAINGALWRSHQLPGECLGKEVDLSGFIVTLPCEQRLATGQWRVTAEMDVEQVDDPRYPLADDGTDQDDRLDVTADAFLVWRDQPAGPRNQSGCGARSDTVYGATGSAKPVAVRCRAHRF